jgi:hypothetical protein
MRQYDLDQTFPESANGVPGQGPALEPLPQGASNSRVGPRRVADREIWVDAETGREENPGISRSPGYCVSAGRGFVLSRLKSRVRVRRGGSAGSSRHQRPATDPSRKRVNAATPSTRNATSTPRVTATIPPADGARPQRRNSCTVRALDRGPMPIQASVCRVVGFRAQGRRVRRRLVSGRVQTATGRETLTEEVGTAFVLFNGGWSRRRDLNP